MAASARGKTATYLCHEEFSVDTQDHEDHTFCGMMFDVCIPMGQRPVDVVRIESVWVRGALGPLTVWTTETSFQGKHETQSAWEKIYDKKHRASFKNMVEVRMHERARDCAYTRACARTFVRERRRGCAREGEQSGKHHDGYHYEQA